MNWQDVKNVQFREDLTSQLRRRKVFLLYDIAGFLGHDVECEEGKRGNAAKGVLRFCIGVSPNKFILLESIHD